MYCSMACGIETGNRDDSCFNQFCDLPRGCIGFAHRRQGALDTAARHLTTETTVHDFVMPPVLRPDECTILV